MNKTGIIILAAGNSSRFGTTKQLLNYNGKTLIQHVADEALNTELSAVIIVTGSNAETVSESLHQQKIEIVFNKDWKQGMATGVICGLSSISSLNKKITNVIIAVCDQPFVSASLFHQLMNKQIETDKHIIACTYADTIGTPALFTQKYFDALMKLQGDEGAKKIFLSNKDDVATVDFPQGNIDIDTQKDYEQLLDKQKHIL